MFQLSNEEYENFRSHFVTSNKGLKEQVTAVQAERLRSQFVILNRNFHIAVALIIKEKYRLGTSLTIGHALKRKRAGESMGRSRYSPCF